MCLETVDSVGSPGRITTHRRNLSPLDGIRERQRVPSSFTRHSSYYRGPHVVLPLFPPLLQDILPPLEGLLRPSSGARTTLRLSSCHHSYSGLDQLGEGFGSSPSMVEFTVRISSPVIHIQSLTQPYTTRQTVTTITDLHWRYFRGS